MDSSTRFFVEYRARNAEMVWKPVVVRNARHVQIKK